MRWRRAQVFLAALPWLLGAPVVAAVDLEAITGAVNGLVHFFSKAATGDGALATQATAQAAIRRIVTEIAFPAPKKENRPGVLKSIPIVMGAVQSLGTEIAGLRGDWRFSERTAPMEPKRRADVAPKRAQLEALFGPATGRGAAREELHRFGATLAESLISSHIPAAGQWAAALPAVEHDSAVGSRRTPGEALRDAAWLTAGAGRVAQNNSDLMAQRLALGALDLGQAVLEQRLDEGAALSAYAAFACLSGCPGGRR